MTPTQPLLTPTPPPIPTPPDSNSPDPNLPDPLSQLPRHFRLRQPQLFRRRPDPNSPDPNLPDPNSSIPTPPRLQHPDLHLFLACTNPMTPVSRYAPSSSTPHPLHLSPHLPHPNTLNSRIFHTSPHIFPLLPSHSNIPFTPSALIPYISLFPTPLVTLFHTPHTSPLTSPQAPTHFPTPQHISPHPNTLPQQFLTPLFKTPLTYRNTPTDFPTASTFTPYRGGWG